MLQRDITGANTLWERAPPAKGRQSRPAGFQRRCLCRGQISSTATAVASPPPMHRLATPRVAPARFKPQAGRAGGKAAPLAGR